MVSAIVPTIGRARSLERLLQSLSQQTHPVAEVIVADASVNDETKAVANEPRWQRQGLRITYVRCLVPNAVQQRNAAIARSTGEYLLFLDDDVALQADCVGNMVDALTANLKIVAVTADLDNQTWPQPTKLWRAYMKYVLAMPTNAWQGRVCGPLLRFGYNPTPQQAKRIEWLGMGNSLIRFSAFTECGGFSEFFLHRSTINEDIDLSMKLTRRGTILFCPRARMSHYHVRDGRVSSRIAAEDDLFNRFHILHRTIGYSSIRAFASISVYFCVETTSHLLGAVRRLDFDGFADRLIGRLSALQRIIRLLSTGGSTRAPACQVSPQ